MKKFIVNVLRIVFVFVGLIILLSGCFYYALNCKKTLRDTSSSPDGKYKLTLIEIGEPAWPFGAASGRLTLKKGDTQINQADFELKNDGCSISSGCWTVTWDKDYVEVILSGEDQFDEQILLYFDGTAQRQTLYDESEQTIAQTEIDSLDIKVMENRENELVFAISIHDYIRSYNGYIIM